MSKEPLSERCSVMKHPERPVPGDCPKDALYIRTTDEGGACRGGEQSHHARGAEGE